MNRQIRWLALAVLTAQCYATSAQDPGAARFEGSDSDRTAAFETDGPWMLDWSTRSDFPLSANFEMRLHDGATGDFIGTIAQLEGVGRGLKLFDEGGSYQIAVVASNVTWELEITDVSEQQAAEIKRRTADEPSLQDATRATLRRVRESTFSEWRPEGNEALLLFDGDGMDWRATFAQPCPGLDSATAISFVTPPVGSLEYYDSILLDDGTRCYFDRVVPTLAPE